jgi:hypothetical protein
MAVKTPMIGQDPTPATPAETRDPVPEAPQPAEIGGRGGLDPVRYGDWEKDGRCIDFRGPG